MADAETEVDVRELLARAQELTRLLSGEHKAGLVEERREIYQALREAGWTWEQIGQEMGVSEGAVRSAANPEVRRARRAGA